MTLANEPHRVCRRLARNRAQLFTLFALGDLLLVRKKLMA